MKRNYPTETIDKWGAALIRVYELQGPADFEKYQYGIARILHLRANRKSGEKLLQYAKDISRPKEVLLNALTKIMLSDSLSTNSRTLAVNALRVLVPKKALLNSNTVESVGRAMEDIINSPQLSAFHNTVKNALKSINKEVQNNKLRQVLSLNVTRELRP